MPKTFQRAAMVAVLATLASLTGCASIMEGTGQTLSVETSDANGNVIAGAHCSLTNDKGSWMVTTPNTVVVHRSAQDLSVICKKTGIPPAAESFSSSTKGMAYGNILLGGFIGGGVDVADGAAFDYPNLLNIVMGAPVDDGGDD